MRPDTALAPGGVKALSAREQEVFALLNQGCYYQEIADRLGITYATTHTHIRHIYRKLQVRSRSQAVAKLLIQLHSTVTYQPRL